MCDARHCCTAGILLAGLAQAGAAAGLPDPTRPANYVAEAPVEIPVEVVNWRLSGITISSATRSAVLNNRLVVIGQTIGPATVIEIRRRSVLLDYNGEQVEIELARQAVKQPVSN